MNERDNGAGWQIQASGVNGGNVSIYTEGSFSNDREMYVNASTGNAGNISITSATGSIATRFLEANGGAFGGNVLLQTPSGSISLYGGAPSVGMISAQGSMHGGSVTLLASNGIYLDQEINTNSPASGGNVVLSTRTGNICFYNTNTSDSGRYIDTMGGTGAGGNISISIGQTSLPSSGNGFVGVTNYNNWGEASFNTSSNLSSAGNITITITSGPQGQFGSACCGDWLQLVANSNWICQ